MRETAPAEGNSISARGEYISDLTRTRTPGLDIRSEPIPLRAMRGWGGLWGWVGGGVFLWVLRTLAQMDTSGVLRCLCGSSEASGVRAVLRQHASRRKVLSWCGCAGSPRHGCEFHTFVGALLSIASYRVGKPWFCLSVCLHP